MEVICKTNSIQDIEKELRSFAFTQNETGQVDLTPGRKYVVYGYRVNKQGVFYLVLTDDETVSTPWWMPASFFENEEISLPHSWVSKAFGHIRKDTITAPSVYFSAIEDVEDGTVRGKAVFEEMKLNS